VKRRQSNTQHNQKAQAAQATRTPSTLCTTIRDTHSKTFNHHSMKDVQSAIAYNWSTLSPDAEGFLLSEPNRIHLTKLLQFWSGEEEAGGAVHPIASVTQWLAVHSIFR
jgi:hypothetical protein